MVKRFSFLILLRPCKILIDTEIMLVTYIIINSFCGSELVAIITFP